MWRPLFSAVARRASGGLSGLRHWWRSGQRHPHIARHFSRDGQPVKIAANLLHRVRGSRWMDTIRQQHHDAVALAIDPDRGAGESGVSEVARREHLGRDAAGSHLPSESARVVYSVRLIRDRIGEERIVNDRARHLENLCRRGKESGVPRATAADVMRIAIVRFAPDESFTKWERVIPSERSE